MAVKRYDGSQWVTVAGKGDQGTSSSIATWVKTVSGGETSLSGNDDNSQALSYTVGQELVFINGALLKRGSDYTATTGNSITGLTALAANDVVTVWTVNAFSVTNAISSGLVTTTGDIIYASAANTPARLGIGSTGNVLTVSGGVPAWAAPASTYCGVSVYDTANQTISNNTSTAATWNSEYFDTDGFHSTTTNTSRLTVPAGKGGYYLISFQSTWALNATGVRGCELKKNGSNLKFTNEIAGNASYYVGNEITMVTNLVAGDYIELFVKQTSGGNLSFEKTTGGGVAHFSMQLLGA